MRNRTIAMAFLLTLLAGRSAVADGYRTQQPRSNATSNILDADAEPRLYLLCASFSDARVETRRALLREESRRLRGFGVRGRFVASSELKESAAAFAVRFSVARIGLEVARPHLDDLAKAALLGNISASYDTLSA